MESLIAPATSLGSRADRTDVDAYLAAIWSVVKLHSAAGCKIAEINLPHFDQEKPAFICHVFANKGYKCTYVSGKYILTW